MVSKYSPPYSSIATAVYGINSISQDDSLCRGSGGNGNHSLDFCGEPVCVRIVFIILSIYGTHMTTPARK